MKVIIALLLSTTAAIAQYKQGVIVGEKSLTVRRIVQPHFDDDLKRITYTVKGERMIIMDRTLGIDMDSIINEIIRQTGLAPLDPQVVVVDKDGTVTGTALADPDIDVIPGKTLIRSKDAAIGDKVDAAGRVIVKGTPLADTPASK